MKTTSNQRSLLQCWDTIWESLEVLPPFGVFEKLCCYYSEDHRFYHTLSHLEECFNQWDEVYHLAKSKELIGLALFFHDSIYNTRRNDNEEKSAEWAVCVLKQSGVSSELTETISKLILVTKHDKIANTPDEMLMLDIDLSILGTAKSRFIEYEKQIRCEYQWVPEDTYRESRSSILWGFLNRPRIYQNDFFFEQFETQARTNLQDSLSRLNQPR